MLTGFSGDIFFLSGVPTGLFLFGFLLSRMMGLSQYFVLGEVCMYTRGPVLVFSYYLLGAGSHARIDYPLCVLYCSLNNRGCSLTLVVWLLCCSSSFRH